MTDLLIVGAGPTGLALAIEAARHGVSHRIIDKRPAPSEHSKALGVQPRTIEIFDAWGVAAEAVARGLPVHGANIHMNGERIAEISFDGIETPYSYLLILSQSETERILEPALMRLGGSVEREVELMELRTHADGVEARLQKAGGSEETLHARWAAGCDGAHSTVRHAVGLSFEGASYPEEFVLGDFAVDWELSHDRFQGFFAGHEVIAAAPMPGEKRYRLILIRSEETGAAPTVVEFEDALARIARVEADLSDPVWLARFRVHRRIVPRFREGPVFLLGDAAHIHSPVGGQGMNTGIQDARNLGWKLGMVAAGTARPALLDTYDGERRPIAEMILGWTDRATNMLLGRSMAARLARSLGPRVALAVPSVVARVRRTITQIALTYPGSPIVGEGEGAEFDGGPEPGERAPDAPLEDALGGAAGRVFDLLRGAEHVLLAWGVTAVPEEVTRAAALAGTVSVHALPEGPAARIYGVTGPSLHLIRPDGHVAWRGPLDAHALTDFLAARYRS